MSMIKVWPRNEQMRNLIKHPVGGAFHETGSRDWPNDSFTYRRIRDGDVVTDEGQVEAPGPVAAGEPKAKAKKE
jgi:hypothetical protein